MTIQTFVAGQTLTDSQMNTLQASDFNHTSNVQSGASYTLVATDVGKLIEFTNNGSIVFTIPPNSSIAFNVGDRIDVLLASTGNVTVTPGSGVTVNAEGGLLTISSQRRTRTRCSNTAWTRGGYVGCSSFAVINGESESNCCLSVACRSTNRCRWVDVFSLTRCIA